MTEPIHSAADLRTQLAALIRRYVSHLDADAKTELTTVRVEATGPNMTLIYAEHSTNAPTLTVTLNELGDAPAQPPDDAKRAWLR
jgi:hypothetical protein